MIVHDPPLAAVAAVADDDDNDEEDDAEDEEEEEEDDVNAVEMLSLDLLVLMLPFQRNKNTTAEIVKIVRAEADEGTKCANENLPLSLLLLVSAG